MVPLSVQANFEQSQSYYIKKLVLVVDNNPSPVVGVFTMPEYTITGLSTRIRVNAYSFVRAIAETSDGALHMAANYVKASGGCSAPAMSDGIGSLGKMKLRQWDENGLLGMQLMINHPNNSGLQIDQLTRHWIPPDYVTDVKLTVEGEEILSFAGGISISENPSFRFVFGSEKEGVALAKVSDSKGRQFSRHWDIEGN